MHEDLNRVVSKPYLTMPSDLQILGYNDIQINNLYVEAHLKRNQSIVQDLVSGWSKSTVNCLVCKTTSKRLQPFLTYNIYLGKRERKSNFVNGQIVDPLHNPDINNADHLSLQGLQQSSDDVAPGHTTMPQDQQINSFNVFDNEASHGASSYKWYE